MARARPEPSPELVEGLPKDEGDYRPQKAKRALPKRLLLQGKFANYLASMSMSSRGFDTTNALSKMERRVDH